MRSSAASSVRHTAHMTGGQAARRKASEAGCRLHISAQQSTSTARMTACEDLDRKVVMETEGHQHLYCVLRMYLTVTSFASR